MQNDHFNWFDECLREGFEMLNDDDPADVRPTADEILDDPNEDTDGEREFYGTEDPA